MYTNHLILFILSVICGINAQLYLGDVCETEGYPGICKYDQTCNYTMTLITQLIHPKICGFEGSELIVCCPNRISGVGVTNSNLEQPQPPEPEGCPPLPKIQTPPFQNPAHKVAWEKCVANERYVNICEQDGVSYNRRYTCSIPTTSQRVSGGGPASPMEFPHMAVLGCDSERKENDITWVGGGSLISSKYILTAAHVLISYLGPLRHALLGSLDKTDLRGGQLFGIIRLIPHNKYSTERKENDIALVELNRPVEFSKFIRPVCLPVPGIDAENEIRVIAGWGEIVPRVPTNLLHKALISIVDGQECSSSLSWPSFVWDDKTMICTRGLISRNGKTDSCQGDGGGPVMYRVRYPEFSCNFVVDGLVSWGPVCSRGQPSSNTKVSAYVDWIVETVWPAEYSKAISDTESLGIF